VEARIWSMASARLPLKSVWQPTKVEPFNLKTEERGHQHSTKWLQNRCVSSQLTCVCPWWLHIYSDFSDGRITHLHLRW